MTKQTTIVVIGALRVNTQHLVCRVTISADDNFDFFLTVSRNYALKSQSLISGKNKKNTTNLPSAEFADRGSSGKDY